MDIKKEISYLKENSKCISWDCFNVRILSVLEELNDQVERLMSLFNRHLEFEITGECKPKSELKPCPFLICRSNDVDASFDGNGYHYHCYECMAAGPSRPTEREARKAWNERLP